MDWRLLVNERVVIIAIPLYVFAFCGFNDLLRFGNIFCSLGSLQTSQLCVVSELAGGGSVAVAYGISDM